MKKQRKKGLPIYEGARKVYSLLIVFIIGETAAVIAQAYFLARALTFLFEGRPVGEIITDIGFFFVAFVLRYILVHTEELIAERYAVNTAKMLRNRLVQSYFHEGFAGHRKIGTGHLVTLAMEGVDHVKKYIEIIGIRMFKSVIMPVMIVIFVFLYDKISAVILVVTVPIVIVFMILLGMAAEKMADKQFETYTRLSNHFMDSLKGLETLAYLGRSRAHAQKIGHVSNNYRKATMKTLRMAFLSSFALDFFTSLAIAFVAVGLGLRLIDGHIILLPALTILILAPEYFAPIKQVGKDYHATLDGQVAISRIDSLLDMANQGATEEVITESLPNDMGLIALKHVTVEKEGDPLLQEVSFVADKGWTAIVGKTGAGKSTLLNVIAGRQPVSSGAVKAGEHSLTQHSNAWMQKTAYIPQQPYIFPISLADNIRFYEPQATDDAVIQVIDRIGLGNLVRTFPEGMYEKIGEGGRSISGGQAQRVAIARALIGDKPVILLDEPTAHLDIETAYEMKQLMLDVLQDKTVFLATHQLHWMGQMDQIILLEDGTIRALGTHDALLKEAVYQEFTEWQKEK